MKMKQLLGLLLTLAMAFTLLPAFSVTVSATAGTPNTYWYTGNPGASSFTISTADELAGLAELVNDETDNFEGKTITVSNDIDLSDYGKGSSFNDGKGWIPIGTYDTPFMGDFNGGGNKITGLYINCDEYEDTGLFGDVFVGNVKNLSVIGVEITGGSCIGGIVGWLDDGASVEDCFVSGTITATGYLIGGMIGRSENGTIITGSYSKCDVSGSDYVGGLAGDVYGSIKNCYATGNISGSYGVGGLAGYVSDGSIENCYATGDVSGDSSVGGLAGDVYGGITSCVALNAKVSGIEYVGRVAGDIGDVTFEDNYAYTDMIVTLDGSDKSSLEETDGKDVTVDTIKTSAFWTDLGWDEDIWAIEENKLPTLKNTGGVQNGEIPSFISVTISPSEVKMLGGEQQSFDVVVAGPGNPSQGVVWSLSGNNSSGTTIINGELTVAADETALKLTVRATSVEDSRKSDKAVVFIIPGSEWYNKGIGDEFHIGTEQDLRDLAQLVNLGIDSFEGKTIHLTQDIALTQEWIPIGVSGAYTFMGTFDGSFRTISGLSINNDSFESVGLFGNVDEGTIQNLCLADVDINGSYYVGGVAGYIYRATVKNCLIKGKISGDQMVGGVIGNNTYGEIINCGFEGDVDGNSGVGGIVGFLYGADAINCYASGAVTGDSKIGGIVGYLIQGDSVKDCYAANEVKGTYLVGGIAGVISYYGDVINCVALNPSVSGKSEVARVVSGVIESSHGWSTSGYGLDTMGVTIDGGDKALDKGINKPDGADIDTGTAKTAAFWKDTMKWDEDAWHIEDGFFPVLKAFYTAVDAAIDGEIGADSATITLSRTLIGKETLIIAVYSGGKLLKMTTETKETMNGSEYELTLPTDVTADRVKVMWWADMQSIKPICKAYTLEYTDAWKEAD